MLNLDPEEKRGSGMKKGTCDKCGSSEVYTTTNGAEISIGIDSRSRANMLCTNYLCMKCGYLETYLNFEPSEALTDNITNEKKREKIRMMYQNTIQERINLIKEYWEKVGW